MNIDAHDSDVWEIRLVLVDAEAGRYTLRVHDPKQWTQAGPLPLRFPSPTYALRWLDSLAIKGSRKPSDDDKASRDLTSAFVSAKGNSTTWGPIVSALFHADHPGPYLASQWWFGREPPFVGNNPMVPVTQLSEEILDLIIQVFVSLETHRVVALRKQIGSTEDNVQFLWWADGGFSPAEPAAIGGGRQFIIYPAHLAYAERLGPMARGAVSFPQDASVFFSINPTTLIAQERFSDDERAFVAQLIDALNGKRAHKEIRESQSHLAKWLTATSSASASEVANWIADCMIAVHHRSDPTDDDADESAMPAQTYEEDDFYEVLIGPDAQHLFALHHISAHRAAGQVSWQVDEHEWRVNGAWDEQFPDELDDWRWAAETERLQLIPDRVAEINAERGRTEEFILAWDVSDAIRIDDSYEEDMSDLFDQSIDIPVGLAHWMSLPPEQEVTAEVLEAQSDNPRYVTALTMLSKATKHSTYAPPDQFVKPLIDFIVHKRTLEVEEIAVALVGLINWFHAVEIGTVVEDISINPQDLIGTDRLVKFVAALIAMTNDVVVINVESERYPDGVYVQMCREDDGALAIEAVSNRYLTPPLTPDEITALHALGWEDPQDDDLPNYLRYLEPEQTSPGEVAEFLVKTLHYVYGTKPSDSHQFAPDHLVSELLNGEHGPEFAMNPNLSDAQKARLFMGLRFPYDLDPEGR